MSILAAIILGILIGWLIEWVIDWLFWRKRRTAQADHSDCQKQIDELEGRNQALQAEIDAFKTAAPTRAAPKVVKEVLPDEDLTQIKGIGPKISGLLYEAGIRNFTDLGSLTSDGLRDLVGDVIERLADEDSIINQARELAEKRSQGK
jgi:predicted flap endonuclease-1-like 5' DNA nuclease